MAATVAAHAQPVGGDPARVAYERGTDALEAQRYTEATRFFEESYRLRPVPVVLYNLAFAQRGMGRLNAAITSFARYLSTETVFPPERSRVVVEGLVRELRARLATVTLTVTPATFTLSVDEQDTIPTNGAVTLDPGDHRLAVSASGYETWREALRLGEGQRVERTVTLSRTPTGVDGVPPPPPPPPPVQPGAPVYTRWWFWTGVAVVAVGAGVTGVVVANENATLEPLPPGPTFTVMTIRLE